jgi:hypothetical protein
LYGGRGEERIKKLEIGIWNEGSGMEGCNQDIGNILVSRHR